MSPVSWEIQRDTMRDFKHSKWPTYGYVLLLDGVVMAYANGTHDRVPPAELAGICRTMNRAPLAQEVVVSAGKWDAALGEMTLGKTLFDVRSNYHQAVRKLDGFDSLQPDSP